MHQSHIQADSVGGSKQSARTHSTLLSRNEKRQRSSSSFTSTSHDRHHTGGFGIVVRSRSQKSASPIVNQHRHHESNEGNLSTHRRVSRKTRSELRQGRYAFEGSNSGHSRSLDAYTAHLLAHAQTADEHEPRVNTDNVKRLMLQSADISESGCMNPIHGKRMQKRQRQRLASAVQSKRCLTQRDANIPESLLENLLGIDAMEVLMSLQSGSGPFSSSPTVQSQSPRSGWVTLFQHNCLRSLASMLVCPHTVVPITVGLFSRSPGMNENIYLQTLSDEIAVLTSTNPYHIPGNRIKFNFSASFLPLLIVLLTGYLLGLTLGWQLGLAVALTGSLLYAIVCCIIFYGVRAKRTPNWIQFSETLSRYMRGCYLLLNILFCRVPPVSNIAQPVKLLPISLDVSNCVSAMNAVALMTEKLWMYMEQKYGKLAVRMQWASKDVYDDSCQTYRKCCCLPLWLWFAVYLASSLSLATLLAVPRQSKIDLRSAVQAAPQSKPGSKSLVSDTSVNHNWMHITAITCGVLAGISLFVLIVAACPSLINLMRGRPFQRGAQRMRWKDDGKLHEPLFDECYSRATGMFDPTCMRKNGGISIERCVMCPRECAFHLHSDLDSTFTSTAAANQWRSTVRSNRKKKADLGGKSERIRTSLDVEHRNDGSRSDAAVDDFSESSQLTEEDEDDEFSSVEQEEIKHVEESETCIHSEPVLFNSGEELIPNLNKCKATSFRDTSNDLSGKNRKATEAKTLARWKKVIKKGLLEGCKCLSMIDARAGGRQTRVIISITGTGVPFVQVDPLGKLSALIRLIDKLLMQPPGGGTSGDVNVVSKPYSSNDHTKDPSNIRRIREAVPNHWTPNVIVLLTASVPTSDATKQHISNAQDALPPEFRRPSLLDASVQWSNFKVWWSIHHYCHLPIYIEEQPPGFFANEASEQRQLFERCGAFTISPFTKLPPDSTLLNLYAEAHELAILNRKHLRHLLTMTAFVGRMIILDRLLTWQNNSLCGRPHCFLSLGDLDWCVNALVTWLCLVKHWPFHAAWLAIFIEEQLRSDENVSRVELHRTGSQKSRNLPEDSQSFPDVRLSTSNLHGTRAATLSMETTLSQLHLRVLKRLAFAVEAARQKALSASVIATEHGDGDSRRPIQMYSPRVISTLEMCNLALRDRNPRRLAEFLQHSEKDRFSDADCHEAPRTCSPFDAGQVTVGHLLRIMKLTPFLNPHISAWIRDISSTKHISNESVNDEKSNSAKSIRPDRSEETLVDTCRQTPKQSHSALKNEKCPIRLKHGLPKKMLSEMSVDDVCCLLGEITDLSVNQSTGFNIKSRTKNQWIEGSVGSHQKETISNDSDSVINDSTPPAPTNWNSRLPENKAFPVNQYVENIRLKNVNGSVLSVCSLKALQKELSMSFGDWQLFSALIIYLRSHEYGYTRPQTSGFPHSAQQTEKLAQYKIPADDTAKKRQQLINTTSDTSLALTVRSAPLYENSPRRAMGKADFGVRTNAKSMVALCTTSHWSNEYASRGVLDTHNGRSPFFCQQHGETSRAYYRDNSKKMAESFSRKKSKDLFCPRHQERCLHPKHALPCGQSAQRHLTSVREGPIPTQNRHTCGASGGSKENYGITKHLPIDYSSQKSNTLPKRTSTMESLKQAKMRPCVLHPEDSRQANIQNEDLGQYSNRKIPETGLVERRPAKYIIRNDGANSPHIVGELFDPVGSRAVLLNLEHGAPPSNWQLRPSRPETQVPKLAPYTSESSTQAMEYSALGLSNNSSSTSLAGEMVDEVAESSPSQLSANMILAMGTEQRDELPKEESSDHPSDQSCDCKYWYSLEAALQEGQNHLIEKVLSKSTSSGSGTGAEIENSVSDSLSTCRSQHNRSSDTGSSQTFVESSSEQVNQP